jgi:zinc-ribbon domain
VTDPTTGGVPDSAARCPWCSAEITPGVTTCPSCGAALSGAAEDDRDAIPGVTTIDPITAARKPVKQPNRLVSWLAGDLDPLPGPDPTLALHATVPGTLPPAPLDGAGPESYAPPSAEVRREMARLELEAIRAELESAAPEAAPPGEAGPAEPTAAQDEGGSPA